MKRCSIIPVVLFALSLFAFYAWGNTVTWKSASGGNWSDPANWNPHHVPGPNDTAVITASGNYTVTLDVDANVGGLILGAGDNTTQTFLVNGQTFTLAGQATMNSGGQFFLNSGTFNGDTNSSGAIVNGNLSCLGGILSGKITVAANNQFAALALLGDPASNTFSAPLLLTNYGTINWSNTVLYAQTGLHIYNYGVLNSMPSAIAALSRTNVFYGNGAILDNFGTFQTVLAFTNATVFDDNLNFNNYGVVTVTTGPLTISKGSGGGTFNITTNLLSGSNRLIFGGSSPYTLTTNANFTGGGVISGSLFGGGKAISGNVTCSAFTFAGTLTLSNDCVVNFIGSLGANTFSNTVFNNYGTVNWNNSNLYGLYGPTINNYGLWDAKTNATFWNTGPFSSQATFNNYGIFRKSGGSGNTTFDSNASLQILFQNSGTVDVESGTLLFQNAAGGPVNGNGDDGTFNLANGSIVNFSSASYYIFRGNTTFSGNGTIIGNVVCGSGNSPTFNGTATFSGATFSGYQLTVNSNAVVNFIGTHGNSTLNNWTLINYGTVNWSNTDLSGGSVIANYGLWDAKTNNTISGITFNNYGTFRKSGGNNSAPNYISLLDNSTTFNNYGTVDIQIGFLNFDNGSDSGIITTATNGYTQLGNFVLTGNPSFIGPVDFYGSLTGSDAVVHGSEIFNGTLSGTITLAADNLLNTSGGNITFNNLVLTNYGTVVWSNNDLYGQSSPQIYNYALWDVQSNNSFYGGSSGTTFNNYGTFRKSGGTWSQSAPYFTILDNKTTFNNYGTLDVQIGILEVKNGTGNGVFNTETNAQTDVFPYSLAGDNTFTGAGLVFGDLTGSNVVIHGILSVRYISFTGTFTIASDATLNFGDQNIIAPYFYGTTFTNYGTINWGNTDLHGLFGPQICNYGLWNAQTNNTFSGNYYGGGVTVFNNYGIFRKSGGTQNDPNSQTTLDSQTIFNNSGTADVQTGLLAVQGNYSLAGGTLNFGINNSNDFGSISFATNAALAGTLSANFNNGYTPVVSNSFPVVTYGSESGTFTSLNLPHLPSTLSWQTDYGSTTFTLIIVPAPPLLWIQSGVSNGMWTSVACSADGGKLTASAEFSSSGLPSGIYLSTNSGATWQLSTNANGWLAVACSADGSKLLAVDSFPSGVTTYTATHISTNSGASWQSGQLVFMGNACTIASSANGRVLIVGLVPSHPMVSTNGGLTWWQSNLDGGCYVACSADGTKLFAAGRNFAGMSPILLSHLNVSTNSGVTWQVSSNAPYTTNWSSIACSANGETVIAAFYGGSVYTSIDAGQTWSTNNLPVASWRSVASSADGTKMIATFGDGNGGGIYTSTNSGVSWILNNTTNLVWFSAASSADGNKLAAIGAAGSVNSIGGIYSFYSLPMPSLCITPTNGNIGLAWIIPSTNFVLQSSSDLINWADLTNQPVLNLTNLQNQVGLPPPNANAFYRLKTP